MANRHKVETGDAENTGFGLPKYVADHKPGFDHGGPRQRIESGDDHRFRRSEKKDVPHESLAARIRKPKKRK
jgi:hypothetical protein